MSAPVAAERAAVMPVVEVFGPTFQGEGPDAGRRCWFVRFGGCDYRCSWCDTMYAVEPAEVRAAPRKTVAQVAAELAGLGCLPGGLVILSGGNPALHQRAGELVDLLHEAGIEVAVETQGSVWRPWLGSVDTLVISPKPPSSDMATDAHRRQFHRFMARAATAGVNRALKVVVGGDRDLEWAAGVHAAYPEVRLWLSALTPQDTPPDSIRDAMAASFTWLCDTALARPELADVRLGTQLHVIAWGAARGV